jgi:hypothetical protein
MHAGDTVVTAGVHLLKEGQKVKLLDAPALTPVEADAARDKGAGETLPATERAPKRKG